MSSGTSIGICRKNYVKKGKKYKSSPGIVNRDWKTNNPGIKISVANGRIDNLSIGIGIINANREADNSGKGTGISDADGRLDNSGIGTNVANRKVDNPSIGISTTHTDRKADNSSKRMGIVDTDKRANNLGIDTSAANGRADKLGIGIVDINTDGRANGQVVTSNKACASLISLYKTFFILIFSSKLKTIFASLFVFFLSPTILIKQEASFSKYFVAKI